MMRDTMLSSETGVEGKGELVHKAQGKKRSSLYMVYLLSEGVTVPDEKKQNSVHRVSWGFSWQVGSTGQAIQLKLQPESPDSGLEPVFQLSKLPDDYLLTMESVVCSQSIPDTAVRVKWESVGQRQVRGNVAVIDVGAWGSFNGPSG
ncbi:hypothetical protein HAX54_022616 [Datura stramonium]|uniref:Uncharacterized protein n=1 Tax=Datura stramonium TaxID=4076 RepID=A0ABS8S472_DATST|nr:hypothetical protein [Datura stramonium]